MVKGKARGNALLGRMVKRIVGHQWEAALLPSGERHVTPLNDLMPHTETTGCWCKPFEVDGVYVHNSLDRREKYECGELQHN